MEGFYFFLHIVADIIQHARPTQSVGLIGCHRVFVALDEQFRTEFGDSRVRQEWFSEVLKLALAITATDGYESFSDIAEAALKVIEERHQHQLSGGARKKILGALRAWIGNRC